MHRLFATSGALLAFAGAAYAEPAMTMVPTEMRQHANSHSALVQSIPAKAMIDVVGCGKVWCTASWRDIAGYVRASSISAEPGAPPLIYSDAPPPPPPAVVFAPPLVVAPFGCCWGPGWGWHRRYWGY